MPVELEREGGARGCGAPRRRRCGRRRRALWRSRVSRTTTMDARRKVAWTSRGAWVARGACGVGRVHHGIGPARGRVESAGDRAGRSGDRAPNVSGAMAGNVSAPGRDRTGRTGRTAVGTPSTRDARGRVIVDAGRSGMARDGKGSSRGGSSHPRARRRRASLRREKSAVGPGDEGRGGIKDRGAVAHLTPSPRRPPPPSSSSSTLNASSLRNIVAIARLVE